MIPTIAEAAREIAAKRLSPVELAQACLARVEAHQPALHAFIHLTAERALDDARAAEARQMAGTLRGPLDGIPIGHKDIYETAGIPTTGHSAQMQDHVPEHDAFTVARWREAGVALLGKLATHEFAFGGPSFDLPWPPARNPWDTERFTAGSSSGTGAAVASGMVLGGTGSDTGGSIRGPAALCGIAGIKPSYGLCSRTGVLPLAHTLDTTGPMAWTSEDCALLLEAMAGHDPADPSSASHPLPSFDLGQDLRARRVGVIRHFHESDHRVSDATLRGIEESLAIFRARGMEVVEVTLPPLQDFHAAGWVTLAAEAWAVHEPRMREKPMKYGEALRARLGMGALLTAGDYLQAQRKRREIIARTLAATEGVDLLVTAAVVGEAPRITDVGKFASIEKPGFTIPFNILGWPALSVCSGFGAGGLPVAVQIVGKPWQDGLVLAAGHAVESENGHRAKRPALLRD
ncbi:amidase [Roseococcus suduntuyensis]|uniref:Aspartyl-tRNA(Asn)/glutamyl-tRNA(Gln) amidotransferase subunit A n=1 Tax=Roseococcus suduntuyensis TaxID=455361 RepID=A0A840AB79_9PROT|nr:amidase [Roseococcus suduntuyensis]MBB3898809.1 aspartyl-tRNA(Asn)/glutamyl-tRNA(Gln) amidotransferase subunit A [Roseococcus suduntuyensis]